MKWLGYVADSSKHFSEGLVATPHGYCLFEVHVDRCRELLTHFDLSRAVTRLLAYVWRRFLEASKPMRISLILCMSIMHHGRYKLGGKSR